MEITEIKDIARKKPFFLTKLVRDCKHIVIDTVNEAFSRNYKTDDKIEVLSYKTFSIISDRIRFYELKLAPLSGRGLVFCLTERESIDFTDGTVQLFFDELVLNTGNVALIASQDFERDYRRIRCIIDTPGGTLKFAVPMVKLMYPSRQIIEVFLRWAN